MAVAVDLESTLILAVGTITLAVVIMVKLFGLTGTFWESAASLEIAQDCAVHLFFILPGGLGTSIVLTKASTPMIFRLVGGAMVIVGMAMAIIFAWQCAEQRHYKPSPHAKPVGG